MAKSMDDDALVVNAPHVTTVNASDFVVRGRSVYMRDGETLVGTLIKQDGDDITVYFWIPPYQPDPMSWWARTWNSELDDRENGLLQNCEAYAMSSTSGVPQHALMILVAKMANLLDKYEERED